MRNFPVLLRSGTIVLLAGVIALAACGGTAIPPEKALTMPVAEAAGGQLSGAVLDRWMVASKNAPNRAEATGLISAWLNDALLIDALRRNRPLDDQVTFDSVILETAKRVASIRYFARRDSLLPPITERQVDSVLDIDNARVFQQIVLRLKGKPDSASIRAIFVRAGALRNKLAQGGDFTAAVKEFSDDSSTKAHDGFLTAITATDAARLGDRLAPLFRLAPNSVSPVIPSPYEPAVIIFRRATRAESRAGVKAWLAPILARRADGAFVDSLTRAKKLTLAPDAVARARAIAAEPVTVTDNTPLATWDGGALSGAAVRVGILSFTPSDRAALTNAPDTTMTQYLNDLARREIVLPLIAPEPLPTPEIRAAYQPTYRRLLDSLRAIVGRLPSTLSAADAATQQLDSALVGHASFLPLPWSLAAVLRARSPVKVDQAVLDAIIHGVVPRWQTTHKDDSVTKTAPPAANQPPGALPPKP
jgi:PPIC-type peptidyl-prolyl cis-trans isomerase-like protein